MKKVIKVVKQTWVYSIPSRRKEGIMMKKIVENLKVWLTIIIWLELCKDWTMSLLFIGNKKEKCFFYERKYIFLLGVGGKINLKTVTWNFVTVGWLTRVLKTFERWSALDSNSTFFLEINLILLLNKFHALAISSILIAWMGEQCCTLNDAA